MNDSGIKVENLSIWDFDRDQLKDEIKDQSTQARKHARRLVARKVISGAGDFPGKDSGLLARSIFVKRFRSGMGFYITHKMKDKQFRYPFVLAYGRKAGVAASGRAYGAIEPRKDYIAVTVKQRRKSIINAFRKALFDATKAERII